MMRVNDGFKLSTAATDSKCRVKKGQGRKLVPRDFLRCEPHHSMTEVNETGNAKATGRC